MNVIAGIDDASRRASLQRLALAALPPLSPRGHEVVTTLVQTCSLGWSADQIAGRLGFPNRHALARLLESEGLPPVRHLTHWLLILGWVLEWEAHQTSLFRQARDGRRWPRAARRIIQVRTGLPWAEVRARGSMWVASELAERCPGRASATRPAGSEPVAPATATAPLPSTLRAG